MDKKTKLKAALVGYGIGDALGKGTEFMEGFEVRLRYPDGLRRYDQIYQDYHRSQWAPGQWTNDTEMVIMFGEQAIEDNQMIDPFGQGIRLVKWYLSSPLDVVPNLRWVLSQTDYLDDPYQVTERVWKQMNHREPSNEALGRALFASLLPGDPVQNAIAASRLTHFDSRCDTCAAITGQIARSLLETGVMPSRPELKQLADSIDPQVAPIMKAAYMDHPDQFEVDDPDYYWEVCRSLGIVLWALLKYDKPEEALYAIIDRGGDADTTSSLLLAFYGLRDGQLELPQHLFDGLEGRYQLEALADRWAENLEWR